MTSSSSPRDQGIGGDQGIPAASAAAEADPRDATMRALRWDGPHTLVAADVPRPRPLDGWALVDVAYTGLCGSDLHVWAGEHPRARPGLVIGHEMSGTLAEGSGELRVGTPVVVNPLLPCGTCVTCLAGRPHTCANLRILGIDAPGGAAEQVLVPAGSLVPLPDGTDLALAAFAEPLAVAVMRAPPPARSPGSADARRTAHGRPRAPPASST